MFYQSLFYDCDMLAERSICHSFKNPGGSLVKSLKYETWVSGNVDMSVFFVVVILYLAKKSSPISH